VLDPKPEHAAAHHEPDDLAIRDDRGADEPVIAETVGDVEREHISLRVGYECGEFAGRELAAGRVELRCALEQLGDTLKACAGAEPLDAALNVQ
jgi:hypothetical protein